VLKGWEKEIKTDKKGTRFPTTVQKDHITSPNVGTESFLQSENPFGKGTGCQKARPCKKGKKKKRTKTPFLAAKKKRGRARQKKKTGNGRKGDPRKRENGRNKPGGKVLLGGVVGSKNPKRKKKTQQREKRIPGGVKRFIFRGSNGRSKGFFHAERGKGRKKN